MNAAAIAILLLFTFGTTIFYVLLAIERRVWAGSLTFGTNDHGSQDDVRFVHRVLKHLIPVLPPSNGVVVVGGLAAILWQCVLRGWDARSQIILGYYLALQLYIIFIGRIAAAVRDVWTTSSDGEAIAVRRGVWNLIRQHRNGLIHAAGLVILEIVVVIVAT
jgi:hypothetical protein